jgi:hypothetical protein
LNGVADLAFVAIGRGGVDVPVPGLEGGVDGVTGLVGGCLEDAEAEGGYLDAVVQRQERDGEGHSQIGLFRQGTRVFSRLGRWGARGSR